MDRFCHLFVGLAALGASCTSFREDPIPPNAAEITSFEERLGATIPDDVSCDYFDFNRRGTAVVYRAKRDGKLFIVHNNQWSPPLDEVEGPWISDDGGHVAYRIKEDGKLKLVVDGKKWETDGDIQYPFSSPDGTRWAATGKKGLKEFLIVDGHRSDDFDYVGRPLFSADGRHVAYCVRNDKRQFIVHDGRKLAEYEPYEELWIIGRPNIALDKGAKLPAYLPGPALSPDGQCLAYPAARGGKCFVVIDGNEGEVFDYVDPPLWCPLGRRIAYRASVGWDKWCVVLNGSRGESYDAVGDLVFSGDGSTLAYLATRGQKRFLVTENRAVLPILYAHADGLVLSPRGARTAFVAGRTSSRTLKGALEKAFVVVDGREGPEFEVVPYGVRFSPNSSRVAYRAGGAEGKCYAVVDHRAGEAFDSAYEPVFSPNSQHFAHWARRGDKQFVVIDGRPGEPYDEVQSWPIVFNPDSTRVAFGARKGHELRWVVQKL